MPKITKSRKLRIKSRKLHARKKRVKGGARGTRGILKYRDSLELTNKEGEASLKEIENALEKGYIPSQVFSEFVITPEYIFKSKKVYKEKNKREENLSRIIERRKTEKRETDRKEAEQRLLKIQNSQPSYFGIYDDFH